MTVPKTITLLSFGFQYGLPAEADTVLDTRGMVNPFYEPALREHTGLDAAVQEFIWRDGASRAYLEAMQTLLERRMALYARWDSPNRKPLTVAVGCTGGRHRSVATVLRLAETLRALGYEVTVRHRELERSTTETR